MTTRDQAIEIAINELTKRGYLISDYEITVNEDNSDSREWVIWGEIKGPFPVPGGRHIMHVNKITGELKFFPGE